MGFVVLQKPVGLESESCSKATSPVVSKANVGLWSQILFQVKKDPYDRSQCSVPIVSDHGDILSWEQRWAAILYTFLGVSPIDSSGTYF